MGGHEKSDDLPGQNMTVFAEVILALPLDKNFLYIVPDSLKERTHEGSRVLVPFKDRKLTGIVVKLKRRGVPKDLALKEIHAVLDESSFISPEFLSFTKELSSYYYSSWGELLQSSLPSSLVPKTQTRVSITDKGQEALNEIALSVREKDTLLFLKKRSYSDVHLKRRLKISGLSSVLSKLESKGFIHVERAVTKETRSWKEKSASQSPTQLEMDFSLDKDSFQAASQVVSQWKQDTFSSYLLFGPSKKREAVYFYLIKRALAQKKRILYLVPEIATTRDLFVKFQKRFGESAALLHSRMSVGNREDKWIRIHEGQVDVVLGPRSAVLSPVENLGLVIVDEEQDESYYQRENPAYDARRGAFLRAKQDRAVLVYGSSTPTVEVYYEFRKTNRLFHLERVPQRFPVEIIDHKIERGLLSRKLVSKISETIRANKSVIIFHYRRGYASYIACSRCSFTPRCRNCDISLTYHKREDQLVCHYCGYSQRQELVCPECGHRIIKKRGVGIEAIEEEVKRQLPQSRVLGFDSDVAKGQKDQDRIIKLFREGRIDILIGTQLLAHQQDLPKVPLVVVLYPETILALPDYRANQKAFYSIVQAVKHLCLEDGSELSVQTALPDHFSIQAAAHQDFISFYTQEIKFRRLMNYPPFSHMVEVLFQGENLRSLAKKMRDFSSLLKGHSEDLEILGPALAAVQRLRGKSRVQLILKSTKRKDLDEALKSSLSKVRVNKKIHVYY
jgi:primosomal protein N' (replication factor Y)